MLGSKPSAALNVVPIGTALRIRPAEQQTARYSATVRTLPNAMRVASGAMAALFAFSVAVQYNDPDPVRWMAIYGAAMVLSILGAMGRQRPVESLVVAAIAVPWSAWQAAQVRGPVGWGDVFGHAVMKTEAVELVREALGLLIVAGWMIALALVGRRRG